MHDAKYWRERYGPVGKRKPGTSVYLSLEVRRRRGYVSLLKKNDKGRWILIGHFGTMNDALEALEDEAEIMNGKT